jgi:hypothetical protein
MANKRKANDVRKQIKLDSILVNREIEKREKADKRLKKTLDKAKAQLTAREEKAKIRKEKAKPAFFKKLVKIDGKLRSLNKQLLYKKFENKKDILKQNINDLLEKREILLHEYKTL